MTNQKQLWRALVQTTQELQISLGLGIVRNEHFWLRWTLVMVSPGYDELQTDEILTNAPSD